MSRTSSSIIGQYRSKVFISSHLISFHLISSSLRFYIYVDRHERFDLPSYPTSLSWRAKLPAWKLLVRSNWFEFSDCDCIQLWSIQRQYDAFWNFCIETQSCGYVQSNIVDKFCIGGNGEFLFSYTGLMALAVGISQEEKLCLLRESLQTWELLGGMDSAVSGMHQFVTKHWHQSS